MDYQKQQRRVTDVAAFYADDYAARQGSMGVPIYQTSIFVPTDPPSGYHYTRIGNPTFDVGEKKLAEMENGQKAILVTSGMTAISLAVLSCVKSGGHIITLRNLYPGALGGLFPYLAERFNIETTFVDGKRVEDFEEAIRPNTQLIYLESPSSYMFEMQDIEEIVRLAKAKGIKTMIDNTWATPIFQNPLDFGVDLVVHSCSKYIGGHSDLIGGVIVGSEEIISAISSTERTTFGCVMDPHQAWLVARGLRTLPVRMEKHMDNGLKVARFLADHPCIAEVKHPGLPQYAQKKLSEKYLYGYSSLFAFVTKGTLEQSRQSVEDTAVFNRTVSWGGYDSLLAAFGCGSEESAKANYVTPGLIRISVGLEAPETLMEALDTSLRKYVK